MKAYKSIIAAMALLFAQPAQADIKTIADLPALMANQGQMDILFCAATAAGEARGEGADGMQAVLNVVENRYRSSITWWKSEEGDNVTDGTRAAVCVDSWQFSCWNKNDNNYALCMELADPRKFADNLKLPYFRKALYLALMMYEGTLEDLTGGSTHYHHKNIRPDWAANRPYKVAIKNHLYYDNV